MSTQDKPTRDRIILSTIDFIEKYGIHAVTTRGIAKEANVNIASINYYFGSKENLLDETLRLTIKNLEEDFIDITEKDGQIPGELLQKLLYYFLAGSMKFPGITKAHLYGFFVNPDKKSDFVELFKGFMLYLKEKVEQIDKGRNPEEVQMSITQLFSAVLLPCVFPEMFRDSLELDFRDEAVQRKYINNLVSHFYTVNRELGEWHPSPIE